jgi:hypothetical protein
MKVDQDLKVRNDGKVDGTAIIAFSKEFISMIESMGGGKGEFEKELKNPEQPKDLPPGASVKATFYKSGDWVGNKIEFKGVPADKLDELDTTSDNATGSSNDGQSFSLTKEGSNWHFRGVMDMTMGGSSSTTTTAKKGVTTKKGATTKATTTVPNPLGDLDMSEMFKNMKAEIRVKITFPGKVIKANGKVSGNSVTWTPEMGKKITMDAIAKA